MLNKIFTAAALVIACLMLANSEPQVVEVKAAPVVVGSPPGEIAALQTKIAALEAELAKRPTSLPTAACQCKPCECEECSCKPVKGEKLPESPYKTSQVRIALAPVVVRRPAAGACYGGRCYVPQRRGGLFRGIFGR